MLGSSAVRESEAENDLAEAVLVAKWTAGYVDVVDTRFIQDQPDVMSSVDQNSAHLNHAMVIDSSRFTI